METFTFLERNANRDVGLAWKDSIYRTGTITILPWDLRDLAQSWEHFRRKDLHRLSAVDATSFAITKRARIRLALHLTATLPRLASDSSASAGSKTTPGRSMARVVSVHEYELRPGVQPADFERALREAERRGLFELPGLVAHHFLRGLKGARRGAYAALWIFESREAWERLWGPVEAPRPPAEYPENWKIWENTILAPLLSQHPETIRFTSYEDV